MSEPSSFSDLMAQLGAGENEAAARIVQRFAQRLIALARARMDLRLRQKMDPEDVVQSVFKSFFIRHGQGQWDLAGWDGVWALLALLTVRKCGKWVDHYQAARRDLERETPPPQEQSSSWAGMALAREPAPEEVVLLTETVEHLLRDLQPRDREMVSLALQGHTVQEISQQVGRTERTVYRVLDRLRKRLERMQAEN